MCSDLKQTNSNSSKKQAATHSCLRYNIEWKPETHFYPLQLVWLEELSMAMTNIEKKLCFGVSVNQ